MSIFSRTIGDLFPEKDKGGYEPPALREAPVGSVHGVSKMAKIEAALRNLNAGEEFYIDNAGGIHNQKEAFLSGHATPLASFRAKSDGSISVFSGIPPRAPTYCGGSHEKHEELVRNPLQYNAVLRSGDWLGLGPGCLFRIPTVTPEQPRTGEEKLQCLLANASVGEIVSIGRLNAPSLDRSVSRVHATVEILDKAYDDRGRLALEIRIIPGLPSKERISVGTGAAEPEEVQGQRTLSGGLRVTLGALGTVTIPHQEGTVHDMSLSMVNLVSEGKDDEAKFLFTCMSQKVQLEYSRRVVKEGRIAHEDPEVLRNATLLQTHICRGLELIKEGRFDESLALFRNPTILEMLGYRFEENHCWQLREISLEAIRANLRGVSSESWFFTNQKLVYPSFGELRSGVQPRDDIERDLLSRWQKEVALVYAEEYTHALQDLLGSNVSRKAVLFPDWQREADVAVFFHEQGISLSYEFVMNRYRERDIALQLVRGYQVPIEQLGFTKALRETPIGESLYIGSATEREKPASPGFSIPEEMIITEDVTINQGARNQAQSAMRPVEGVIHKNPDGTYTISSYASTQNCQIFVPDASGYYRRLDAPVTLEPGTPFYMGRAFKFVLD